MTSPEQIEANRRNAALSTGPRSEQGKQVTRNNSTIHGLTGKQVVIEGEDAEDFDCLLDGLIKEFAPRGTLERQLIEQLAGYLWRSKRIPILEAAVIETHRHEIRKEYPVYENPDDRPSPYLAMIARYNVKIRPIEIPGCPTYVSKRKRSPETEKSSESEKPPEPEETPEQVEKREQKEAREKALEPILELGRAVLRDASQNDALGKLARYDTTMGNSVKRTIEQLYKLRAQRPGELKGNAQIVDLEPLNVED
jgi:hypothetical protein